MNGYSERCVAGTTVSAADSTRSESVGAGDTWRDRRLIRVALVNDHLGYADGVTHGVTRYFLNVIPRLNAGNIRAEACFLRGPHPAQDQMRRSGIEVTFLGRRKHDPRVTADLIKFVRTRRIDILHLGGMKSIFFGRVAARLAGCRAVIHLHDTRPMGPVVGLLQRRLARWTDAAISPCEFVRQLAITEFAIAPPIAATLHNGVPIDEFAPPDGARESVRREFQIAPDAPVVGMLGRLSTEKQPALLIARFARLLWTHPRAVLLMVGDGPLREQCRDLTQRLGLSQSVRFAGHRQDVPRMLAAMDLVASPSAHEGFPYSALEAAAAGKPVVAFRVGGMPEVVSNGESGVLVAGQDVNALIEVIVQVLAQPKLAARLAEGARRRASRFSIEHHVRRLDVLYRGVMNRDPAVIASAV
jgi:glycosyltransferase involved in cell wall biosynthesis